MADYGAAPMGVPNFVIDQFTIPPFLLPIYQACGTQYGVPWEVLASINRIETAFGTNLNVSSAGALGWMQFIPSSWEAYGVDANNDGRKDPYNPVDAICAAANYLDAAGASEDLYNAIFAYNHADWYVDEVLLYARQYGKIPDDLVGSLTGLTEGAHFPVAAKSRYADDISEREALERATPKKGQAGNAADVIASSPTERGINIYTREGAPVVAVNDGVIKRIGKSERLGRYIVLEDAYGNRFTYAELGEVAEAYPVPKRRKNPMRDLFVESEEKPDAPASAGKQAKSDDERKPKSEEQESGPANTEDSRQRLYAFPERAANRDQASLTGQLDDLLNRRMPAYEGVKSYFSSVLRYDDDKMDLAKLEKGSKVVAGTILGRVGQTSELAPHLHFEIRPTGRGAPKIDPKPILDGWKLLEATAIYRAAGKNPFAGTGVTTGQVLLMSKEQLIKRVLVNNRLELSAVRSQLRARRPDRSAHPRRNGVSDRAWLSPDDHVDALRARDQHHDLGQRLQSHLWRGNGHRSDQRHPRPGQPGPGHGCRSPRQGHARASRHDGARRVDLTDELRWPIVRDVGPPRSRPYRLPAHVRPGLVPGQAVRPAPRARAVGAPDRSDRLD